MVKTIQIVVRYRILNSLYCTTLSLFLYKKRDKKGLMTFRQNGERERQTFFLTEEPWFKGCQAPKFVHFLLFFFSDAKTPC